MRDKLTTAAEVTCAGVTAIGAGVQWGVGVGLIVAGLVGFGLLFLASLGGDS